MPEHLPTRTTPSRRSFLAWTGAAGAAGAVATVVGPNPAASADPAAGAIATGIPTETPIRPPAVPLVVRSPYLSTWLEADTLPAAWPTFWTGRITAMGGIARIDGESYVFLGNPALPNRPPFATMRQTSFTLTATRSTFVLEQGGIELTVEFHSPGRAG